MRENLAYKEVSLPIERADILDALYLKRESSPCLGGDPAVALLAKVLVVDAQAAGGRDEFLPAAALRVAGVLSRAAKLIQSKG